jgi:hypothetical protein
MLVIAMLNRILVGLILVLVRLNRILAGLMLDTAMLMEL